MILDGYRAAKALSDDDALDGIAAARSVTDRQLARYAKHNEWRGSAVELWVTLFFEHRRNRFTVEVRPSEPGEVDAKFDSIVTALRTALLNDDIWPKNG